MNPLVVIWVVAGVVTMFAPIAVLLHELGHVFAIRRISEQRPTVIVGDYPPMIKRSFRSFDLVMSLKMTEHAGVCIWNSAGHTVGQMRWVTMAGPWASAGFAFLAGGLATLINDPSSVVFWIMIALFLTETGSAMYNLLPHGTSDGARLLAYRGLPADAVAPRSRR